VLPEGLLRKSKKSGQGSGKCVMSDPARQIERRALRWSRHPARSRGLHGCVGPDRGSAAARKGWMSWRTTGKERSNARSEGNANSVISASNWRRQRIPAGVSGSFGRCVASVQGLSYRNPNAAIAM